MEFAQAREHVLVATYFETLRAMTGTCRQAVVNFEAERLLPCRFWCSFIDRLEPAANRPSSLIDRISEHMRRWSLSGPPAKVGQATIFGRAVTREALAEVFWEQRQFGSFEAALRNIHDAEAMQIEDLQRRWANLDLGRHVMWATFDPAGDSPFGPWAMCADRIRSILGLDRATKGHPLLLLEYKVDPAATHIPTIVEAYAGTHWLPQFRPAGTPEIKAGHGWTQVWEEDAHGAAGRPEVVHKPVTGRELQAIRSID